MIEKIIVIFYKKKDDENNKNNYKINTIFNLLF